MFIRTKDGIYEVIEENSNYYKCCYDNGRITLVAKFDNDVNGFSKALKQADTIAELCDEFVYNNQILSEEDRYNEEYLSQLYCFNDVYGAIWTDKGLIYVAKMNEDGELELL